MVNVAKVSPGVRMGEMGAPVFNSMMMADGGLFNESAVSGLTATPSGTQSTSYQIVNEMTRVTTVTTALDGVLLPAAAPGLTIIVENASTNPMTVFGAGSDTINGNGATTGVVQMAGSVVIYTAYAAGAWFCNGLGNGYAGSLATQSNATGIVAVTGGQGSATPLVAMMNNIITAPASSGVLLPASTPGLMITVANNGAQTTNVFPPSGSTMNGVLNAASTLTAATVGIYFCIAATAWISK